MIVHAKTSPWRLSVLAGVLTVTSVSGCGQADGPVSDPPVVLLGAGAMMERPTVVALGGPSTAAVVGQPSAVEVALDTSLDDEEDAFDPSMTDDAANLPNLEMERQAEIAVLSGRARAFWEGT